MTKSITLPPFPHPKQCHPPVPLYTRRPATFSTADPIVQRILETSPHFGKTYVLWRVWHEEDGNKAAPAAKSQRMPAEPLEGITTKEEAVAYLKSNGAKATNLKDAESILKYAEKIGVSFPNLTI